MNKILLVVTHLAAAAIGFAAGIYVLPILIAPDAPTVSDVKSVAGGAEFKGQFRRDLKGSDILHWGEGTVSVGRKAISLEGRVAPGPDYKLYLSPRFVDTREDFFKVKAQSLRVGDVKTFENFIVPLPEGTDITRYDTVVVWCERFSMFISAAKYR